MSLILQIETATTSCSVALAQDGKILAIKELNQRNVHAEVVTLFIEEVLAASGKTYAQLDAVAVSSGPGSYTGLRIGVSTAKGLCFALDKPLIAIETLKAMTHGVIKQSGGKINGNTLLCPMIDARRMEVFTALFDAEGNKIMPTEAMIVDDNSFGKYLNDHTVIFFGDGAEKCHETLKHPNATFITDFANSAGDLTAAATKKFDAGDFEDVAYFEPYYLKEFIAGKKQA